MPLRPFGLPTISIQSRFLIEMMIMKPVDDDHEARKGDRWREP